MLEALNGPDASPARDPLPTPQHPFGTLSPRTFAAADGNALNWLGHLHAARRAPLLVHDFAIGGSDVGQVQSQVHHRFLNPEDLTLRFKDWDAAASLFGE